MAILAVRLAELLPIVPRLRPALLALVVLFPLLFLRTGAAARARALKNRTVLLLALYGGWAILGVPFALYRGGAFEHIRTIPIGTLVVIAFLLCAPTRRILDRLALGFLAVATAMGALAYVQGQTKGGRLGTAGALDPNDLGSVMVVALPFALALMLRGPLKLRLMGAPAAAVIGLVILGTGSRGAVLGFAAAALVLVAGMKMTRAVGAVAVVALALPLAWAVAPPAFRVQLATMTDLEADYNMTEDYGRIGTWTRGVGYALAHPVTGVGLGNFGVAEGERRRQINQPGPWTTAHNMYVQAFAELGFPGGTLLLLLLWTAARSARRLWRNPRWDRPEYLAALVGFCVAGFFLSHAYVYHLFAVLGLLAHAGHVVRVEEEQRKAAAHVARSSRRMAARGGVGGRTGPFLADRRA